MLIVTFLSHMCISTIQTLAKVMCNTHCVCNLECRSKFRFEFFKQFTSSFAFSNLRTEYKTEISICKTKLQNLYLDKKQNLCKKINSFNIEITFQTIPRNVPKISQRFPKDFPKNSPKGSQKIHKNS